MNKATLFFLRCICPTGFGIFLAGPAYASDYTGMLGFMVCIALVPILALWSLFTIFLMLNKEFKDKAIYNRQKKQFMWLCIIALLVSTINFDPTSIAMVFAALLVGALLIVLLPRLQTS